MIDLLWIDIEWATMLVIAAAAIMGAIVELRRNEPETRERLTRLETRDESTEARLSKIEQRLDALETEAEE